LQVIDKIHAWKGMNNVCFMTKPHLQLTWEKQKSLVQFARSYKCTN